MAREDVELIRRLSQERDPDVVLEAYDPDVVWVTNEGEVDGGTFRGRAAVRGLFDMWSESFEEFWVETMDIAEQGDWVVTRVRWHGTARLTGMELEIRAAVAYRVREGRIVEAREFRSMEDAMAALGR